MFNLRLEAPKILFLGFKITKLDFFNQKNNHYQIKY